MPSKELEEELEAEKEAWEKLIQSAKEHMDKIDAARAELAKADRLILQSQLTIAKWIKEEDSSDG